MKTFVRITAILLAVSIAVVLAGSFLLRWYDGQTAGVTDDFKDAQLERIIAFAERSNSAYHELHDFRREYGSTAEVGELPARDFAFTWTPIPLRRRNG